LHFAARKHLIVLNKRIINFYSDDLRRRFIKAESTLFKLRYDELSTDDRESFLVSRDFNWIQVRYAS
jgi:hypothetical protein